MAWPNDRIETATPANPVKSNTINAIQDAIMSRQHDEVPILFAPLLAAAGSWSWNANGYIISAGNGTQGNVPLPPMPEGSRIKSVSILVFGDGTSDLDWAVNKLSSGMVSAVVGALQTATNPAAAWATVTYDVPDTVLGAMETFYLSFVTTGGGAGCRVGNISVTVDKP